MIRKLKTASICLAILTTLALAASAQTVSPSTATTAPANVGIGVSKALTDFIIAIATNADAGTEFACSTTQYGQEIGQSVALFGNSTSNHTWSVGLHHATFFVMGSWGGKSDSTGYTDMLGVKARYGWDKAPRLIKYALFNADHVTIDAGLDYPTTDWRYLHFESGKLVAFIGLSRTFGK